jgi:L-serine dehydratase
LGGGSPSLVEKAIVIALSPTIAVPCTPRVMVAGLCAAHIGGAVMLGNLASWLVLNTDLPVTVTADVMMALSAETHPLSAIYIVPTVVRYMEPFFRMNPDVEHFISPDVKEEEKEQIRAALKDASERAHEIVKKANPITKPFGEAVVGGSSQAVGSPANTARIAHYLAKGEITGIKVELYPELFARRGINMPGITMAALYGTGTDDGEGYAKSMQDAIDRSIKIEILQSEEPQLQRVTIYATQQNATVDARNRGGGRLALIGAFPGREEAVAVAERLKIVLVD